MRPRRKLGMKASQKRTGWGFLISGSVLLLITILGHWFGKGKYVNHPPRGFELFDLELAQSTPGLDSLLEAAKARSAKPFDALPPKEKMQVLYETAAARFTHGNQDDHNLFSNWILWGMSKIHKNFSAIFDPELLLKNGHSTMCGGVSLVLVHLALKSGITARHVGLYGHVVMEAWYDGDWHLYDPDMEVVLTDDTGDVLSVEEAAKQEALAMQAYTREGIGEYGAKFVKMIASRENNTYMTYPPGAHSVWKAEALKLLESIAEVVKFILPVAFIFIGALLLRSPRKTSSTKRSVITPAE